MKWISYLKKAKIPFKLYKLNTQDSIILGQNYKNSKIFITLEGFIYLAKVFSNKEIKCISLLTKHRIIKTQDIEQNNKTYYYKAVAIRSSDILSIHIDQIIYKTPNTNSLLATINRFYNYTLRDYETTASILTQKNIKARLIQLLLTLSEEFGKINKHSITIPICFSHETLSKILGTNRVTVTRTLNKLQKEQLITYNAQYIKINNFIKLCTNYNI